MNSKEAIIEKILKDANDVAEANRDNARKNAESMLGKVRSEVEAKKADALSHLDDIKATLIERRKTVANLDAKKTILTFKSAIIDGIFERSVEAVAKDKDYKAMIENVLMRYAEEGDIVEIAERDKDVITADLVAKVAKAKGIKLALSDTYGKFGAGVMLIGENVDKNLTVDSELKAMREDIEQEVARILFGE